MQQTLKKFGYPTTLVKEYRYWYVLVRPEQPTLGCLVLIEKSGRKKFSELPPPSFVEMGTVIKDIERTLSAVFNYDKINYLMLMMVDPEVHFHVIPRYEKEREFHGKVFRDFGWPKPPALLKLNDCPADTLTVLVRMLKMRLGEK